MSTFPLQIMYYSGVKPLSVRKDRLKIPRHQRDHRHLWSAARRMGRFFNLQAGQPVQCDATPTLCVSWLLDESGDTSCVFVRVMLLDVHISLASFSLYLPTVSRRPHPRWRLARGCDA